MSENRVYHEIPKTNSTVTNTCLSGENDDQVLGVPRTLQNQSDQLLKLLLGSIHANLVGVS